MGGVSMQRTVEVKSDGVYLSGEKFFLISGDFHYFRTLPGGWKRRLELMHDFGLTAVTTYVAWNLHEPKRGEFCFEGALDLPRFLQTAAETGLKVLLRCSPYMCAEWEMGGLPSWLLKDRQMCLRSCDPSFLEPLTEYTRILAEKIKPYLYTNGGPIILVAVENEYGSFGNDRRYLQLLSQLYRDCGLDVPFITANGPDPFQYHNGALPECWNGVNGSANPGFLKEMDLLKEYQPDKPLLVGEAWDGSIMSWGKQFTLNKGIEENEEYLRQALQMGAAVNFYMFCGGTNFGFMNGALAVDQKENYVPLTTSYDYDSPISEEGTPREKYFRLRDVLDSYRGLPKRAHIVPEYQAQNIGPVRITEYASFLDHAAILAERRVRRGRTVCMEDLDQDYGFIRYTTHIDYTDSRIRHLKIEEPADRACVYLNGKYAGCLMRDCPAPDIAFTVPPEGLELSILVENLGRINYGYRIYDRKGILGAVHVAIEAGKDRYVYNFANNTGFTIETLPLKSLDGLVYGLQKPENGLPVFCRARFRAQPGIDTFLDMKGWNKGIVFFNGFHLGRYWSVGPQRTLYVPGELVQEENTVEILELHYEARENEIRFLDHSILTEMPTNDYAFLKGKSGQDFII